MRVWLRRLVRVPAFGAYFLVVFVQANLRVAWEVLTPGYAMRTGIVRVPIHTASDWETMLLANAISLTPGTLTLEVSLDGRALYVHALFIDSREALEAELADLERRLLWALR